MGTDVDLKSDERASSIRKGGKKRTKSSSITNQCPSESEIQSVKTCNFEGTECEYGAIRCCDGEQTFSSIKCECDDGKTKCRERTCDEIETVENLCDADIECPTEFEIQGIYKNTCHFKAPVCNYGRMLCCGGNAGFSSIECECNEGQTECRERTCAEVEDQCQ